MENESGLSLPFYPLLTRGLPVRQHSAKESLAQASGTALRDVEEDTRAGILQKTQEGKEMWKEKLRA